MLKLAVLISGRGSNLQSLIDACADPEFPAEINLVISNVADVQGLERAANAGIKTRVVDHRAYTSREAFDEVLDSVLAAAGVDLVCLAGFMRLLTDGFVNRWTDKLINIHPSLLPSFKGLHTHERAIEAGVRFTGCTVHFVRPAMDEGPIIVQAVVPVMDDDSADQLAARVLIEEHKIYPLAVRLIAEDQLRVQKNRVRIRDHGAMPQSVINPEFNPA